MPQEFTGQMKCKLWLIKNCEHKVDTTTSLESILCSASKETFGRKPLLPNILGQLIKEVWNEEKKVVKRGPTNKQEKHYLNLSRKDEKSNSVDVLDQPLLPNNWTSISDLKKSTFFKPKPIFLIMINRQLLKLRILLKNTMEEKQNTNLPFVQMESNWTYSEILILLVASKSGNNNRFCRQINAL